MERKLNAGIDYGLGQSNIDHKTGIRYGVISQNSVLQAWCDSSEPFYGSISPGEDEEPVGFTYDDEGYKAETCLDTDIMIIESPFFTYCKFCSPCCPGAGDLNSPMSANDGIRAYCFGHDWFDDGKAPYTVWCVSDHMVVLPKEKKS